MSIYQTNGIQVSNISEIKEKFYVIENHDTNNEFSKYSYPGDEIIFELDKACVDLYDTFRDKIFVDKDEYYRYLDK